MSNEVVIYDVVVELPNGVVRTNRYLVSPYSDTGIEEIVNRAGANEGFVPLEIREVGYSCL